MIKRLNMPDDTDAREIASISVQPDGKSILCVNVYDTNPTTWGILLSDLLRQVAVSLEAAPLVLNGQVLSRVEIEAAIRRVLNNELSKPTSDIDQAERKDSN